jgi:hypothetical protein
MELHGVDERIDRLETNDFFRGGSGGLIKRLGISTSYWNYNSFGGHFLLKATWNYGKVECWPPARRAYAAYASERILGMKSGKHHFIQINVESTFFNDVRFDSVFP